MFAKKEIVPESSPREVLWGSTGMVGTVERIASDRLQFGGTR